MYSAGEMSTFPVVMGSEWKSNIEDDLTTESFLIKRNGRLIFDWLRSRYASKELMVLEQLVVFENIEDPVNMNDVAGDETADHSEG